MMPFVDTLSIENFGCVRSAKVALTPLHALVGPNDCGKTMTLHAVRLILQSLRGGFGRSSGHGWTPFDPKLALVQSECRIALALGSATYVGNLVQDPVAEGAARVLRPIAPHPDRREQALDSDSDMSRLRVALTRTPRLLRLDADALRQPSEVLRGDEAHFFRDERGTGLAALLDALRDQGESSYEHVADQLRSIFPSVRLLQLDRSSDGKQTSVAVRLEDGSHVTADLMSHGMLYVLAFLVVAQLEPAFFLIEHPEKGLHPAQIVDVMSILREMSKTSQVLLATHSPLVVNELQADEVTVFRRTAERDGAEATLLSKTADFDRRSKMYATGELWLNYANGVDESPLVDGGPRP